MTPFHSKLYPTSGCLNMRDYKSREDITGMKWNRLTAVRVTDEKYRYRTLWLFKCDCGVEKLLLPNHVRSGSIKSCGCLYREYQESKKPHKNCNEADSLRLRNYLSQVKHKYKLSEEQVRDLMDEQKGICGICDKSLDHTGKVFHIDHEHNSGKIRGLLCPICNLSLGKLGDTVESITKVLKYLKHKE